MYFTVLTRPSLRSFLPARVEQGDRGVLHVFRATLFNTLSYICVSLPAIQIRHRYLLGGRRFCAWVLWTQGCNLAFAAYSFGAANGALVVNNSTSTNTTSTVTNTTGGNVTVAWVEERPLLNEATALVLVASLTVLLLISEAIFLASVAKERLRTFFASTALLDDLRDEFNVSRVSSLWPLAAAATQSKPRCKQTYCLETDRRGPPRNASCAADQQKSLHGRIGPSKSTTQGTCWR